MLRNPTHAWLLSGLLCLLAFLLTPLLVESPKSQAMHPAWSPAEEISAKGSAYPISPLPESLKLNPGKVALGRLLFHDARLSGDGSLSCASCHDLSRGGVDGLARSVGVAGEPLAFNTPTVFNSGLNFRQFWDGRALTLEAQVDGPLLSPLEMGSTWEGLLDRLGEDPEYRQAFAILYEIGLAPESVRDAIATFERSLITTNAPIDRFLRGEEGALSPAARRGLRAFLNNGCVSCHQGAGIGGNMFQVLGTIVPLDRQGDTRPWPELLKVPSLRNVALTGPYLHDGSVETLPEVIALMARHQLGRTLPDEEVDDIVAFLESLTGVWEGRARP